MSSLIPRLKGNGSLLTQKLPFCWLTLRQFRAGWSLSVVGFFAAFSAILSAIYLAGVRESSGSDFLSGVFLQLLVPTALPLATLILATSALGNEIGDGTLPYCLLKPVWRLRIVLEKYLGVVAVTGLAFALGLTLTWEMLALGGESMGWHLLGSLLLASIAGVLAYGALFLLVSLVIPRALLVGIIYILLWESMLARFIPGLKLLSLRHLVESAFAHLLSQPNVSVADASTPGTTALVLGCVVIASLALAALRLRLMDVD